jgi:hypothetical protein
VPDDVLPRQESSPTAILETVGQEKASSDPPTGKLQAESCEPATHDPEPLEAAGPVAEMRVESFNYPSAESYSPRSLPPERLANLNELRELANISATAAIQTFEKGRAARNAFDRVPLIMVGLSCGVFLLYFATTCESQMMQLLLYLGVGLSFLAATVAAGQAVSVLFCWLATARQTKALQLNASANTEELSADDF